MKKTIAMMGILAAMSLGQAVAGGHPELSEGDEAFSAENYEKAQALYRHDAEMGVIAAQVSLAIMYQDGLGLPKDLGQAAKWFAKAAEQGNGEAQYNLGLLYQDGKGVEKNPVEADKWFILAGSKPNAETLEKSMTAEQIAEAKKKAEEWKAQFKKSREQ